MQKRLLLVFLLLFPLISIVSAQNAQGDFTNIGSNFETSCNEGFCTTTIYSYDKYFDRNGTWELIDESWHSCADGFCTNDYYFNATADSQGLVSVNSRNGRFNQRISNFGATNISLSAPEVSGSLLTYRNILPNVDLVYQYLPHKLKEEMIIKRPIQNLQGQDFEVNFPISGNLNPSLDDPFICDSARKCSNLSYSISSEQISLLIPVDFLNSRDTVYPLVIDPSINLGKPSIIWNGMIQYYFDGDLLGYTRTSNPTSLKLGVAPFGNYRSDIDWNLDAIPSYGAISNATFSAFFESITTNRINITNMEKNSSQYLNSLSGNGNFYNDMLNGTVYSNYSVPSNTTNLFVNFTFNQQGINDLNTAFGNAKRFNFGIHSDNSNDTISARDNSNSSRRPTLIIKTQRQEYNITYDANGNMIQGFGKYLEYDGWNRLSRVRNTNSTGVIISEYFYNHEGNRIKKIVYNVSGDGNNESTYYMNTRPADFIQVVNTNGTIINETYIYLQDKLIAKIDTQGRKFFYHPDHLGSTSLVTNESGAVVEDLLYLPYGGILGGDEVSRYTYTGQESDTESGFIDYGARQYDSRFSRFIQPDPVISDVYNPQNLNHYTYVLNNPYKYVDPNGKWAVQVGLGFSGGFTSLLFTKSVGFAFSRSDSGVNELGLYESNGRGALFGVADAGGGVELAYNPDAQTLSDLAGTSKSVDIWGRPGEGPTIGLGADFSDEGVTPSSYRVSGGLGATPIPIPVQASVTQSTTKTISFRDIIKDAITSFKKSHGIDKSSSLSQSDSNKNSNPSNKVTSNSVSKNNLNNQNNNQQKGILSKLFKRFGRSSK